VGNLRRGGSLERDQPTSVSGDTLWGSGCHGLRAGIVAKPVRGGGVNASPRRRGGTPWRGWKPRRASASEPLNPRAGGTDPRGEQSPEVGLPQFGPRTTATSASVRSPSGGRAHLGRAPSGVVPWTWRSFGITFEADHPAPACPSSWRPRVLGVRGRNPACRTGLVPVPGRVSFGRRFGRDPSPGFVSRCHGRIGRGVPTEAVTARGKEAPRGVRLLEGEKLWRVQPQGRHRHETRPGGFGAECKA